MKLSAEILPKLLWFLDYDGSLCPHQEVWEERIYDPDVIFDTVDRLRSVSGGVLWNTGRRPESLGGVHPGFLGFKGYFIQGSCVWTPTQGETPISGEKKIIGPLVPESFSDAALAFATAHPEYKLEINPTSLRLNPYQGHSVHGLESAMGSLIAQTPPDWRWLIGNRGAELLADGFDKGTALRLELESARNDFVTVAVGDDILDRPAIEESLRRGGFAVIVGEGCGWVTEIPHKMDQLIYCEDPYRVLELMDHLSAGS